MNIRFYLAIIVLIKITIVSAGLAHADKIILTADTWCPYNCPSENKPGIIVEVAKEIFGEQGHEVIWKPTPYSRALRLVRQGRAHAVPGAYISDAPDFIFPKNHVVVSQNQFHVREDSKWTYQNLKSLSEISLGIVQDFTFGDPIDSYLNANRNSDSVMRICGERANLRLIKMLFARRIDAVLEDRNVFQYWSQQIHYQTPLKAVGMPHTEYSYIAFSPNHPKSKEYADILDRGLKKLRQSGRIAEIMLNYGVIDTEFDPLTRVASR